ncbi:ferredoxin reductase [Rhodoferax saidenbachensis]|uniref:Ferredoxin reductase n=2 Tax=Rhodoferax saidenbachensis TaxID=1484693 RepID=A0A1P8KFV5_9BURK|nr:ferredoxin reductase [Rhodoferax saidenbachensis]
MVRSSAIEDTLTALHPLLSLSQVRARVERIVDETPDTKTFVLRPNAHWQGACSGQFVRVQIEMDGRLVERVYSLSSPAGAKRICITVKRQDGGQVSTHLHSRLRVGDVLTLSQAAGEFVLPAVLPAQMLLLSAGSGITPVMAMLRELHTRRYQADVLFVYMCRNAQDMIFGAELQQLQATWPALRLVAHFTGEHGRLDTTALQALVPDLAQRATWMCGPGAWMDSIHALWGDAGFAAPLHSERFAAAPRITAEAGAPAAVVCTSTGKTFTTSGSDALLVQAERAGLAPKHGCRMGICASCQCTKTIGTVQNLVTGDISSAPNETIRLCISAARSDLTLIL